MRKSEFNKFQKWYADNKRPLPWRRTKDPYKIWISETMLQQTTSTAVIPYYHKFLKTFPSLNALSTATLDAIYEKWAGLGYYSRANNLQKAAQILIKKPHFPKTWTELIELPGFGPYTSRAVSSLAFNESVGVLDGNVIRFLTRYYGLDVDWWKSDARNALQEKSDQLASLGASSIVNQSLMEMGATLCTPKSPYCIVCPLLKSCQSLKDNKVSLRPRKKTKRKTEKWLWEVCYYSKNGKIALVKNTEGPFLKGQWVFPSQSIQMETKPDHYVLRHSITHHDIYVRIKHFKSLKSMHKLEEHQDVKWINRKELKKVCPSSLLQKVISTIDSQ